MTQYFKKHQIKILSYTLDGAEEEEKKLRKREIRYFFIGWIAYMIGYLFTIAMKMK